MASRDLTVHVHAEGVDDTLAALRRLPDAAMDHLRERAGDLAALLARRVAAAAQLDSPQSALMAPTVRARRGTVPSVAAGGSRPVGRNRAPAYGVLFGSEFGAHGRFGWYAAPQYHGGIGRQYRPHRGSASYWFFKTIEDESGDTATAWRKVADDVVRSFAEGG